MKKLLVSIMLVILMMTSSVLTACGGEGEGGGDAAIDYSKTIVFYSTQGDSLQKVTANAIASFEAKNPGWKVEHIQPGGYDETKDKIVSDFQAASQPDLAYCYPDHVAQYLKTGKVVDLNKFINDPEIGFSAEVIADFVPGYYNEGYARNFAGYESAGLTADSMITLPFVKSTELMYVNKTALDALDLPIATTWDELWAQCEAIVAKYPTATPLGYDSEANWFITMCEQYGSPYTSATGDHYVFDNEVNRQTATIPVYLDTSNNDNLLVPGNYVDIYVRFQDKKEAILVPQMALVADIHGTYVMCVNKDNIVEQKYIKLGDVIDDKQIVLDGLKGDERVIIQGLQKVAHGIKVNPNHLNNGVN